MNRYESIILDKMVDCRIDMREATRNNDIGQYANDVRTMNNDILLLLDCICDFREPTESLDVSEGYGAMCEGGA